MKKKMKIFIHPPNPKLAILKSISLELKSNLTHNAFKCNLTNLNVFKRIISLLSKAIREATVFTKLKKKTETIPLQYICTVHKKTYKATESTGVKRLMGKFNELVIDY